MRQTGKLRPIAGFVVADRGTNKIALELSASI